MVKSPTQLTDLYEDEIVSMSRLMIEKENDNDAWDFDTSPLQQQQPQHHNHRHDQHPAQASCGPGLGGHNVATATGRRVAGHPFAPPVLQLSAENNNVAGTLLGSVVSNLSHALMEASKDGNSNRNRNSNSGSDVEGRRKKMSSFSSSMHSEAATSRNAKEKHLKNTNKNFDMEGTGGKENHHHHQQQQQHYSDVFDYRFTPLISASAARTGGGDGNGGAIYMPERHGPAPMVDGVVTPAINRVLGSVQRDSEHFARVTAALTDLSRAWERVNTALPKGALAEALVANMFDCASRHTNKKIRGIYEDPGQLLDCTRGSAGIQAPPEGLSDTSAALAGYLMQRWQRGHEKE